MLAKSTNPCLLPPAGSALLACSAAGMGLSMPVLRYWVDEVLWSQGRVATIQIEEVLDVMGGQRTGGPHKFSSKSAQSSLSPCTIHQQAAVALPASKAGNNSISCSDTSSNFIDQQATAAGTVNTPDQQEQSSTASVSSKKSVVAAAAAEIADAADSDGDSGNGNNTVFGALANKRADDYLLGYHHVKQWDLLWTKSVYAIRAARYLQPGQVVSAIAGLNCLTMKKRMVQTLRMALGAKAFSIVPLSFCIPEDLWAWQSWLQTHGAAVDTGLWMLKTGQDAGKGLRLVRTQHAMQVALRPPKNPAKPQNHIKVAQQYITNPLLIQGRKFHLRLWLLVTSYCPLRAYLHKKGLVLFSSELYDQSRPVDGASIKPAVGHVTNYARNEDTWVWDLQQLQQQIGHKQWHCLWQQIRSSSALTAAAVLAPMRAAHKWLQPSISNYGFQMLGLDYLIDDRLHPWLLEVNSAPSIMAVHSDPETCGLIKANKQAMMADMLAVVQHRIVPQQREGGAAATAEDKNISSGTSCCSSAGTKQSKISSMTWQEELAAEMANRGGFEPLMTLFPMQKASIPWHQQDVQLQSMLQH
eukprot:GHRR01008699.1.p1 GENE.GHRR01008699.1~~GHRR01008699.1.p1  ORF type:complete len:583 (+),score=215.80 GHRR01008699.1:172-1920(+)